MEEEELAGTVYLCKNVWISSPVHMCPSLSVFVACVCERACAPLLHCVHSCFVGRGASFFMTFSIWPPEESYYNQASLVLLGTIRT